MHKVRGLLKSTKKQHTLPLCVLCISCSSESSHSRVQRVALRVTASDAVHPPASCHAGRTGRFANSAARGRQGERWRHTVRGTRQRGCAHPHYGPLRCQCPCRWSTPYSACCTCLHTFLLAHRIQHKCRSVLLVAIPAAPVTQYVHTYILHTYMICMHTYMHTCIQNMHTYNRT